MTELWDKAAKFWGDYWPAIVVGIVVGIVVAVLKGLPKALARGWWRLWRKLWPKPTPLPQGAPWPFLCATSFANLKDRIHELVPNLQGDLDIAYQPRLPPPEQQQMEAQIDSARAVILVGRMGIGKTREAIEALRRWEGFCGEPVTVLIPKPPFAAALAVPPGIPTRHIVLFIDNIHEPPFYSPEKAGAAVATAGDFAVFLRECLDYFKQYPDFHVIATARNDLLDRAFEETMHRLRPVLSAVGCRDVPLPGWGDHNVDGLINAVATWRDVTIPDEARRELARRCAAEGTASYALLALSRLDRGGAMTLDDVQRLPATFNTLWEQTRRERIEGYTARRHIFVSLALLRVAGLAPLTPLAVEVAARLWGRPLFWRRRQVRAALPALSAWVEPQGATLGCADAYLPPDVSLSQASYATVLYQALVHLSPQDRPTFAAQLVNLGNFLQAFPLGVPMANLGRAIAAFSQALRFYLPDTAPLNYAATQNNLGIAYSDLAAHRDPEANLGQAIAAYTQALRFRKPDTVPLNYATTQNNLGATYSDLAAHRDPEANLGRAIAAYREALRFYQPDTAPLDYAMTQNNLGIAYSRMAAHREPEANLDRAIAAFTQALRFYLPDTAPLDYAMTQNNLGTAYRNLAAHRDPEANLDSAIAAFSKALRFYKPDTAPLDYAGTQNNLGIAYRNLAAQREPEANLDRAVLAYSRSLVVRGRANVVQAQRPARALRELQARLGADRFARMLEAQTQALGELGATAAEVMVLMEKWAP